MSEPSLAERVLASVEPFIGRCDKTRPGVYCVRCGVERMAPDYPTLHDANLAADHFRLWRDLARKEP